MPYLEPLKLKRALKELLLSNGENIMSAEEAKERTHWRSFAISLMCWAPIMAALLGVQQTSASSKRQSDRIIRLPACEDQHDRSVARTELTNSSDVQDLSAVAVHLAHPEKFVSSRAKHVDPIGANNANGEAAPSEGRIPMISHTVQRERMAPGADLAASEPSPNQSAEQSTALRISTYPKFVKVGSLVSQTQFVSSRRTEGEQVGLQLNAVESSESGETKQSIDGEAYQPRSEELANPLQYAKEIQPLGVIEDRRPVACPRMGLYCASDDPCGFRGWRTQRLIPWEVLAQGEYIGPVRPPDVPVYRLRVDDQLDLVFRLTRQKWTRPYRFDVGDEILVESLVANELDRQVTVGPDGMITLRQVGQVAAADRTIEELRKDLEERYKEFVKNPTITVTPVKFNTRLEELRAAVDRRYGAGGQSQPVRVAPDGTIQLPALDPILVQGLTLAELKREVDARYNQVVEGLEVTPILVERAPRFVYVLGEVRVPGRYVLEAPTTSMQAIALAGGWNVGAGLNQIVVFRRDENWNLMATKLRLARAVWGKRPCPADEIWLRDSDIVLLPKSDLLLSTDFIELMFTRGIYGVMPFQGISINFTKLGTL